MSRKITQCYGDPYVIALTDEINKLQLELTRLRNKRKRMANALKKKAKYRKDAAFRERQKARSLARYYRTVRPKLFGLVEP